MIITNNYVVYADKILMPFVKERLKLFLSVHWFILKLLICSLEVTSTKWFGYSWLFTCTNPLTIRVKWSFGSRSGQVFHKLILDQVNGKF